MPEESVDLPARAGLPRLTQQRPLPPPFCFPTAAGSPPTGTLMPMLLWTSCGSQRVWQTATATGRLWSRARMQLLPLPLLRRRCFTAGRALWCTATKQRQAPPFSRGCRSYFDYAASAPYWDSTVDNAGAVGLLGVWQRVPPILSAEPASRSAQAWPSPAAPPQPLPPHPSAGLPDPRLHKQQRELQGGDR